MGGDKWKSANVVLIPTLQISSESFNSLFIFILLSCKKARNIILTTSPAVAELK